MNFSWPLLWGLCSSEGSSGSSQAGVLLDTKRSILAPTAIPTCPSNSQQGSPKTQAELPLPHSTGTQQPLGQHCQGQECIFHALGTGVGWGHPGAIRAICHLRPLWNRVGRAALLPLPGITPVLQTKSCRGTSPGAICCL